MVDTALAKGEMNACLTIVLIDHSSSLHIIFPLSSSPF